MNNNNSDFISTNSAGKEVSAPAREDVLTYLPRADVVERNDSLILLMDVPGVRQSDLDIHYEKNTLTITAEIPSFKDDKLEVVFSECGTAQSRARYRRSFIVSDVFDTEKIQASLKDGVLKIELPKSEKQKPRKIQIKAC